MAIERDFDIGFVARLTADEKQIQQNYRPIIGVHKWFARRPGALFRSLLLSEFACKGGLQSAYFKPTMLENVTIADPFMGGGTTAFEANRIGCNVLGFDVNPMAYWIVKQELGRIDLSRFMSEAERVATDVEREIGRLYRTACVKCGEEADVKYFLWVKQQRCSSCKNDLDLFPGYMVATNDRHTHFVLHCPGCKQLVEFERLPPKGEGVRCPSCATAFDWSGGAAKRNRYKCQCGHEGRYPAEHRKAGPPRHRLFGLEYHCERCKSEHRGRFFKTADRDDVRRFEMAARERSRRPDLLCPSDEIPDGDETKRLHRWGYTYYHEMFNARQLFSLGLLAERILEVRDQATRHALSTVFSDSLRYQNMLCRYDTYALKCQDIFAVHGFPVGLIQCENNVLGIPKIGSGSFRHFVEKYARAKRYCEEPFETRKSGRSKTLVPVRGERIEAEFVGSVGELRRSRRALIAADSIEGTRLRARVLDGVFTDPPYFDNVQYAELMDFCYSWLRLLVGRDVEQFGNGSTRSAREFTGNRTLGRDLLHFTEGLSRVFSRTARMLKPGAPFVFTYHHNDVEAYVPVVVAVLDAGLICTASLPCPAEMTASLHINGTGSSVMDSILVCRADSTTKTPRRVSGAKLHDWLMKDRESLARGRITCTKGDLLCLGMGHLARVAIGKLRERWDSSLAFSEKAAIATNELAALVERAAYREVVEQVLEIELPDRELATAGVVLQGSLFD